MPRKRGKSATMDLDTDILTYQDEEILDEQDFDDSDEINLEAFDGDLSSAIISSATRPAGASAEADASDDAMEGVSPLSDDSVKMYLREIGRVPLLTAKQEI